MLSFFRRLHLAPLLLLVSMLLPVVVQALPPLPGTNSAAKSKPLVISNNDAQAITQSLQSKVPTGDYAKVVKITNAEVISFRKLWLIDQQLKEISFKCLDTKKLANTKAVKNCLCPYRPKLVSMAINMYNVFKDNTNFNGNILKYYQRFSDGSVNIQVINTPNLNQIHKLLYKFTEGCDDDDIGDNFVCANLGDALATCRPYRCHGEFGDVGNIIHQVSGNFNGSCVYHEIHQHSHKVCHLDQDALERFGDYYEAFYQAKINGNIGALSKDSIGNFYQVKNRKLYIPPEYFDEQICKDSAFNN